MYNNLTIVISIFLVINLKCTGCAVVYSCYKLDALWKTRSLIADLTNGLCENYCKDAAENNTFYGTSNGDCYCRETEPSEFDKEGDDKCNALCPGNNEEICGGQVDHWLITVSEIDGAVVTSCYKYEQSWKFIRWNGVHNYHSLCENQCKEAHAKYLYYGINRIVCYCRETEPSEFDKEGDDECNEPCPGNNAEICGGHVDHWLITVSEIDRTPDTLTAKRTQTTDVTAMAVDDSFTTTFPKVINTCTSATETKTNGEWSNWDNWTLCEVNCIQEDTTDGKQIRRRKCDVLNCLGNATEERSCSVPGICKGMRPRKLLCKCPKRLINTKWHFLDGKNITNSEVKKMVLEDFNNAIKSKISVDKKTLSKEVRKKNSSVNKKKIFTIYRMGCIVFLILPMVFLIAIDILNCCIHFRTRFSGRKRNRIRPNSNIQVQRDSSKPLQENVNITESYYASRCGNNFHPDEMKLETYQRRRDDNYQQSREEWLQYI